MSPHLKYASYVARHKWFVFLAGLRTKAPLWRLLIHDWSKLTPAEWGPYVNRFMRGDSGKLDKGADPEEFHRGWTHHWHRNPHHWEHWVTAEGDALRMPEHFVREMVADWMGAGRAITGRWEVADWYAKNGHRMNLHGQTRAEVEDFIDAYGRAERP
jgi:hypothetical protein